MVTPRLRQCGGDDARTTDKIKESGGGESWARNSTTPRTIGRVNIERLYNNSSSESRAHVLCIALLGSSVRGLHLRLGTHEESTMLPRMSVLRRCFL